MRALRLLALACLVAPTGGGWTGHSPALAAGSSARPIPTSTDLVSIRATVNGLLVTVKSDGTLAPSSATVGMAQQFELLDAGKGLIALRSVTTGRFVSARDFEPLRADAEYVGAAQRLRIVGGSEGRVRLKSRSAKGFVCATQSGQGLMAITKHCPHRSQWLEFDPVWIVPPSFAITAPIPESTFTSTTVTFHWDPGGDEYWLNIGSVPGGSDIFSSGSLGAADEHTVSALPLNGQTLYVRVNRRMGPVVDSADAHYTAAIRKGLAIITDFANRRLEDWTGPGFRSVDDLRAQLDEMERYWGWLSRDLERFRWDVIRVQLPNDAVPDAYPDWVAFREAVLALALEQVRIADYDVHGDGFIDTAWLIVSSGYEPVPFAAGGTGGASRACVFVDGQASGSVQGGSTGNFIHETGHCLGLPDLYGTYTTLNKLSVMNDSWALPPQDFSAYDRVSLGWVHPQVIERSTPDVWLPSANESLSAVRISTIRPNEYFLIEYRNPPSAGYGSATQGYRGLAVYHVLASSSMGQDPPLVKLEPADRINAPNEAFDPDDFLSPNTPEMFFPFVARSYYDDGDEIFRIDNVRDRDGGLAFDVTVAPPSSVSPVSNLLINGSFETGQAGTPEAWSPGWYVPQDASFVWPESIAEEGLSSASLQSVFGNDIRWGQSVTTAPGEHYQLCGYLKGESARGMQGNVAANVSVVGGFVGSASLSGTFEWTKACVDFIADQPRTEVACRLGFYGSTAAGKAWCDDFTLVHIRLRSAFER